MSSKRDFKDEKKYFTYTARRSNYILLLSIILFFSLLECALVALLVEKTIHTIFWNIFINGAHTMLFLSGLYLFLSILWTKHRLTSHHLYLHYGTMLKVFIDRQNIAKAVPLKKSENASFPFILQYNRHMQKLNVCFSDAGQVLLVLEHPISIKFGSWLTGYRKEKVQSLLINVDHRDTFLAALCFSDGKEEQ